MFKPNTLWHRIQNMSPFDLQQTQETIRSNLNDRFATFRSDAEIEVSRREYRMEKSRKYKISLMRDFRRKQKEQFFISEI